MMLAKTGLVAMIGKAERGPVAIEAIRKHKAAYLMAVGGAAGKAPERAALQPPLLEHAIARGRVAHAYAFVGPTGSGRMTTALAFAAFATTAIAIWLHETWATATKQALSVLAALGLVALLYAIPPWNEYARREMVAAVKAGVAEYFRDHPVPAPEKRPAEPEPKVVPAPTTPPPSSPSPPKIDYRLKVLAAGVGVVRPAVLAVTMIVEATIMTMLRINIVGGTLLQSRRCRGR